jgi:orotidine-5'-phosphate decarboxylase
LYHDGVTPATFRTELPDTAGGASTIAANVTAADRLIVALDVPTVDDALRAVAALDNVSFFKVGLQLFVTGGIPALLQALRGKRVFVDLKMPGDIGNTVRSVVDACVARGVEFLTLSESMPAPAIRSAVAARNAHASAQLKFLTVPFLSSLDAADLAEMAGPDTDLERYVVQRAARAVAAGCDGIIASGDAIGWCRQAFPRPTLIVSPGIRPAGASADDQKRHTTPADAIRLGADYLVVGRPILRAADPRAAADRVIHEIGAALAGREVTHN